MFYVYAHFTPKDKNPFYIGKGSGNRAYASRRNKYWQNIVNKHGYIVKILERNLTEFEAFDLEANYIQCFGRRVYGGCLINNTDGYEGTSGWKHSNKTKLQMSKAHKQLSPFTMEHRKRLSESQKGRTFSEEHCRKISIAKRGCKLPKRSLKHRTKLSRALLGNTNGRR